jgi:hypothetical protein
MLIFMMVIKVIVEVFLFCGIRYTDNGAWLLKQELSL